MRLDASALRAVREAMRRDEEYAAAVLASPVLSGVLEDTRRRLLADYERDFRFLLFRYIHLRLIRAVISLLRDDPGSIVVMSFRRATTMEFTAEIGDNGRFIFHVETQREGRLVLRASYWNERDFVRETVRVLLDRYPRSVRVMRSPLGALGSMSTHAFVRAVEDVCGPLPSHKMWFSTYNDAHMR